MLDSQSSCHSKLSVLVLCFQTRIQTPYPLFIQHECVYLRRRTFARGNKRRRLLPRGYLESLLWKKPTQHGSFRSIFSAALAVATMLSAAPYPLVGTSLCLVSCSTQICPWRGLRYQRLSHTHSLTRTPSLSPPLSCRILFFLAPNSEQLLLRMVGRVK